MGNINFDSIIIRNKVAMPLNSGCSELEEAANIISLIKIPASFGRGESLANELRIIRSSKENINRIKGEVLKKVHDFEEAEERNRNVLNNISHGVGLSFTSLYSRIQEEKVRETSEYIAQIAHQVHEEQKDYIYYTDYQRMYRW